VQASKVALVSHMWVTKSIVTDAMNILPHQQVLASLVSGFEGKGFGINGIGCEL
jgi:hypothetical protein